MKIVIFETTPEDQAGLAPMLTGQDVVFLNDRLTKETAGLAKDAEIVSVFVNSEVKKDVIDSLPNLKCINTRSTGFDHVDVQYAKSKGIEVCYVPSYGSHTVAEFAFGLILTLSRKLFSAHHQLREGNSFDLSQLKGFDLFGKTIGVIGTGRIGQNAVKIAHGFGMNILAFDLFPKEDLAKEIGFKYVSLDELLQNSDVVTIHVPYTKETFHLLNSENLMKIKPGAILVNTARGEIVETEALLACLKAGIISGAGLDVLEGERELKDEMRLLTDPKSHIEHMRQLIEDHVLIDMENVIVTPHSAFYTQEAKHEILKTAADGMMGFAARQPVNLVKA
ncbi:MAG: NAD(P)-dependent oxidoreductase [Candidatus Saccharibacteria bacterium]